MNKIKPPWTEEQVQRLNEYQTAGNFHPFTCGGCRDRLGTGYPDGPFDDRVLTATPNGWVCATCDYIQDWAWESMLSGWQLGVRWI